MGGQPMEVLLSGLRFEAIRPTAITASAGVVTSSSSMGLLISAASSVRLAPRSATRAPSAVKAAPESADGGAPPRGKP